MFVHFYEALLHICMMRVHPCACAFFMSVSTCRSEEMYSCSRRHLCACVCLHVSGCTCTGIHRPAWWCQGYAHCRSDYAKRQKSVCLSASPAVCLSVSLSVCRSVFQSVCLSVCLLLCFSACRKVRMNAMYVCT